MSLFFLFGWGHHLLGTLEMRINLGVDILRLL